MNEKAHKFILGIFCDMRSLSQTGLSSGLADMICAVSAPFLLMVECLDQLDSDPSQGLLVKLIDRSYDTAAGALALISIGQLREAEVLSRAVYESSVNTSYIVQEAPQLRLAQFFRSYVREEREQNRKWENDAQSAPKEIRDEHTTRARQKNEAMDIYENFIDHYIDYCGINPNDTLKWPGLIERITALDRRLEYRTVYAAMCSQAHHDAEDILNSFVANSVSSIKGSAERMEREADTFSIFMTLFGLRSWTEATIAVCHHLNFSTVVTEAKGSLARIDEELQLVASHLDSGQFPETWVLKAP